MNTMQVNINLQAAEVNVFDKLQAIARVRLTSGFQRKLPFSMPTICVVYSGHFRRSFTQVVDSVVDSVGHWLPRTRVPRVEAQAEPDQVSLDFIYSAYLYSLISLHLFYFKLK